MKKIAVIRIRGKTGVKKDIADTMYMLHITEKNRMVVIPGTKEYMGMVLKSKDFVTYGEISEETLKLLASKRKNLSTNEKIQIFALHPPIGGFERKGIKVAFKHKGALGYRAEKINDLIKRMI